MLHRAGVATGVPQAWRKQTGETDKSQECKDHEIQVCLIHSLNSQIIRENLYDHAKK